MQKRVAVDDLRPGMHIVEMCGAWIDHPFWRNRFTLGDADIACLRRSAIREVVIDIAKGPDVQAPAQHASRDAAQSASADTQPAAAPADHGGTAHASTGRTTAEHVPFAEELEHAARLYRNAKPQVVSMFQEARLGKAIDAARASALVEEIGASVQAESIRKMAGWSGSHFDDTL
jgi:hypothetical protein